MSESSLNILLSGLMGLAGGLLALPINAVLSYFLKREELYYSHKLDVIAKQRELLLEHKLELERKGKDSEIHELKDRLEALERRINNE